MKQIEKMSKKALLKIIKSLEAFPDGNPNPVFRLAADRTLLYSNAGAAKILKKYRLSMGARIAENVITFVDEALKSKKPRRIKFTMGKQIYSFNFRRSDGHITFYGYNVTDAVCSGKQLEQYVRIIEKYVDITTMDLDGMITSASDSFILKTGYSKKQLVGKYFNLLWHRDMGKALEGEIWKKLKNGKSWEGELKIRTRSGAVYWAEMAISPLYDARDRQIGYSAIRKDITAQKQCEILSATDALTGLLNRREFNEILPREVSRAKRKGERLCLTVLDIDNFKKYNDIYGHPAGDKVLKKVSRAMRHIFKRADEFCFRIGGEEFALLFYSDSEPVTLGQLKKIQDAISKLNIPHKGNEGINRVTVSMGAVSLVPDKKYESAALYQAADELMYEVKEESKNNLKLRYLNGNK